MSEKLYSPDNRSRQIVARIILLAVGLLVGLVLGWLVGNQVAANRAAETPAASAVTPSPAALASPTAAPLCPDGVVSGMLDSALAALGQGASDQARSELDSALAAYAELMDNPACAGLAQDLLALQALVAASEAWTAARASGSIRQVDTAATLAAQALELAANETVAGAAGALAGEIEAQRAQLLLAADPGREVTEPETLALEAAGGLFPLCEVNALVKPFLTEDSGGPAARVTRMEVLSDTLYVLAGGQLMSAELDTVLGPSPSVFLNPLDADPLIVAGVRVGELVDLTPSAGGDLLLLEKSGRLLRRNAAGEWSLERQAQVGESPVAVAIYTTRSYLLDPDSDQIWRFSASEDPATYDARYFAKGVIRNVLPGVDMAIDGAVYVARSDGRVRRYYVGVEDSNFLPDTALGTPTAIFLPDEPESTLVYAVDGLGRRVLGLNRESGAFRLGFAIHVGDVQPLTSATINRGRIYVTDGDTLFAGILTTEPVSSADCPARPFPPVAPFGRPELLEMALQLPVSATLPISPSLYPGGRWPQVGFGVADALILTGVPFSDTVRALAPGVVSRIITATAPLLDTDLGVISTTHLVDPEQADSLWGTQIWIDHGNGVETRYGGLAGILPGLAEGQEIRRLTIVGFAGEDPILLGIWVDGHYLGEGYLLPETMLGYREILTPED